MTNAENPIHRRSFLQATGVGTAAVLLGSGPAEAAVEAVRNLPDARAAAGTSGSTFRADLGRTYLDPDRVFSTDVRWWLGSAGHTDETVLEELQALYNGGFRGVELCMQDDGDTPDDEYAYGSPMWEHRWNLMMHRCLDLGMGVYLTSGTNWATSNVPGLDPTSQAAMQALMLATVVLDEGEVLTTLPAPDAGDRRDGARFVTAYAYRVVSDTEVDPDSFVDLASSLAQGEDVWTQTLDWTAPGAGTYRVFAFWTQGTFQRSFPSVGSSYTTNYFDERGVAALREFWEEHYLADATLREKIRTGDVQLFMDSLEMNTGNGFTWWAEDLAEEFQERKGYDITPYLFLIDEVGNDWSNPYHAVDGAGTYRLAGAERRRQGIVNDFQDVLTQLYMERMLTPLRDWLNSVGITTRAQISYGQPLELSEPSMAVDHPEAENRNQYNQVDIFRFWTGGAKLQNKVLSSETTALPFGANATLQLRLQDAYSQFAAGFQRTIWHIWSAGYGYGNFEWPGYEAGRWAPFALMGERFPGSRDYDELNAHLGRVQQLLQTGRSRTDVGFIRQIFVHGMALGGGTGDDNQAMNWQLAHQGVSYRSTELQEHGYTYDYLSPRFLFADGVTFDQASATIEQAGYRAIVLYQDWLDLAAAQRILAWARRGLKVVVLGDAASRTPFDDGNDTRLAGIIRRLKALPTVRTAQVFDTPAEGYFSTAPGGYHDDVLEKLQELGVQPYTGYPEPNHQLLTQTRRDDDGNEFVYAYNYCPNDYHDRSHKESVRRLDHGRTIRTEIVKPGLFVPHTIGAWTGEVTEVADYRWEDGSTVVQIDLDYNDVALFAFEKVDGERVHVVATDAESARSVPPGVVLRVLESGAVATTFSDGTRHDDDVTVPAAHDITGWDLTVQSWRPNETSGDLVRTEVIGDLTTVNRKTSTAITTIQVALPTLRTWNEIPEIGRAVSGTGRYEATFVWDAGVATGAYLDFGSTLEESMSVWINGQKVGGQVSTNPTKVRRDVGGVGKPTIDDGTGQQVPLVGKDLFTGGVGWMRPIADVSPYLVDGTNDIVIEYASALSNVQLDRGAAEPEQNASGWWGYDIDYLDFGPRQATLIPFVELKVPVDVSIARLHELLESWHAGGELDRRDHHRLSNQVSVAERAVQRGNERQIVRAWDRFASLAEQVRSADVRSWLVVLARALRDQI